MVSELIPLDLSCYTQENGAARAEFVRNLCDNLQDHGFALITNHGISGSRVSALFHWTQLLFRLPRSKLQATANERGPKPQRGWSKKGDENTSLLALGRLNNVKQEHADLKEHFDVGSASDTQFPNKWPSEKDLPGFRSFIEAYYEDMRAISRRILAAAEEGLNIPSNSLQQACNGPGCDDELRLNHYPPIDTFGLEENRTHCRVWPHCDFGMLTCLFQDGNPGLEIEDKTAPDSNKFRALTPDSRDVMVVNVSRSLEHVTNNVLKAGLHRVVVADPTLDTKSSMEKPHKAQVSEGWNDKETLQASRKGNMIGSRYSVAYFLKAHRTADLAPLGHFVSEDRPAAFPSISALEFQQQLTSTLY